MYGSCKFYQGSKSVSRYVYFSVPKHSICNCYYDSSAVWRQHTKRTLCMCIHLKHMHWTRKERNTYKCRMKCGTSCFVSVIDIVEKEIVYRKDTYNGSWDTQNGYVNQVIARSWIFSDNIIYGPVCAPHIQIHKTHTHINILYKCRFNLKTKFIQH